MRVCASCFLIFSSAYLYITFAFDLMIVSNVGSLLSMAVHISEMMLALNFCFHVAGPRGVFPARIYIARHWHFQVFSTMSFQLTFRKARVRRRCSYADFALLRGTTAVASHHDHWDTRRVKLATTTVHRASRWFFRCTSNLSRIL